MGQSHPLPMRWVFHSLNFSFSARSFWVVGVGRAAGAALGCCLGPPFAARKHPSLPPVLDRPDSWSGSSSLLTLPPHAFVFFSFGKAHTPGSSSAGAANLLTLWGSENVFIPASSQSQLLDSVENSMLNNFLEFWRHFSTVFCFFSVQSRILKLFWFLILYETYFFIPSETLHPYIIFSLSPAFWNFTMCVLVWLCFVLWAAHFHSANSYSSIWGIFFHTNCFDFLSSVFSGLSF